MNIKIPPKVLGVIIISIAIIGVIAFSQTENKTPNSGSTTPELTFTSEKTVDVALDVLQALNNYYVATQNELNESSEISEIMKTLLDANKYLEAGNIYVEKYSNDSNEIIKLTATGMVEGANMVIKANNELIDFMRSGDPLDTDYAIAKYSSDQKEGYMFISIAAPQFTMLVFEPAKSENPSGKIPYTISEEERKRILKEIERLFGNDLKKYRADIKAKTGKYNAILFSVDAIYNRIAPETYEEAKKDK